MTSQAAVTDVRVPDARPSSTGTQARDDSDAGPTTMPRRAFLRWVGIGTATAFVAADLAVAYRAYDQGVLGVAGAGLACAALAVHRRSRLAAAIGLLLEAVPFAVVTAWSVVTPLTAVLMLAIGLPYVLDRSHTVSARGGAS